MKRIIGRKTQKKKNRSVRKNIKDNLLIKKNGKVDIRVKNSPPKVYEKKIKPYLEYIKQALGNGVKLFAIIKELNVSPPTFYAYIHTKKDLFNTIRDGEEIVVQKIRESLEKRANGFKYEETEIKSYINEENKKVKLYQSNKIKEIVPETKAIELFLKKLYQKEPHPYLQKEIMELAEQEKWDIWREIKEYNIRGYRCPNVLIEQAKQQTEQLKQTNDNTGVMCIPVTADEETWEQAFNDNNQE